MFFIIFFYFILFIIIIIIFFFWGGGGGGGGMGTWREAYEHKIAIFLYKTYWHDLFYRTV